MPSIPFEREFYRDIREKKRTASGIHKKKGKRGYVGKLLTTMDLLSGKEKREYTKSGEIKVSNVYKQLIPFDEFLTYTPDTQKQIMENWRENHTQKEILEGTGMNRSQYYRTLADLEIIERPAWLGGKKEEDANEEKIDIISFDEFSNLDLQEQFDLLEKLNAKYTAREIGRAWDKSMSNIHQLKYQIKNKLKMQQQKQQKQITTEEKAVAIDSGVRLNGQAEKMMQLNNNAALVNRVEVENPYKNDLQNIHKSLSELNEIISISQSVIESHGDRLRDIEKQMIEENTGDHVPVSSTHLDQHSDTTQGMTLKYEEEKEGFILHHQIEKFISVLKKNPDSFKVNISLVKIDE